VSRFFHQRANGVIRAFAFTASDLGFYGGGQILEMGFTLAVKRPEPGKTWIVEVEIGEWLLRNRL